MSTAPDSNIELRLSLWGKLTCLECVLELIWNVKLIFMESGRLPIKQKNSSFQKKIKNGRWELNFLPTAKQPLTWKISLFKKGKLGILGFVAFICFVFADQGRENAFDYWTEMALNWLSFTDVWTLTLHLFKRYITTEPSQSGFHNLLQNICNLLFSSFSIVF